eukprot:scaffold414488_cov16-Prasinocladus_malaysianus.AAC.1
MQPRCASRPHIRRQPYFALASLADIEIPRVLAGPYRPEAAGPLWCQGVRRGSASARHPHQPREC